MKIKNEKEDDAGDSTEGEAKNDDRQLDDTDVEMDDDSVQRAIDFIKECRDDSVEFYDSKFKKFKYFDYIYIHGAQKRNALVGRANLKLPLAFQQVEPYIAQMDDVIFGEKPYIGYQGRNADDDATAEEIQDYTQYQIDVGNFDVEKNKFLRNLGKYGSAIKKICWETDINTYEFEEDVILPKLDPETGMPKIDMETGQIEVEVKTEKKSEDVTMHDGPVFYNRSIYDFFIPRNATSCDVQRMDWVIDRSYRTLEELLENPNYERAHSKIKALIRERDSEEENPNSPNDPRSNTPRGGTSSAGVDRPLDRRKEKFKGLVEVLEFWGKFKFSKDSMREPALITIGIFDDEDFCLRIGKNPLSFKFKPFIMANDYVVEGEAYGLGELDHIEGLIEESTALRNARLDVANISLNGMWLVQRNAGINTRNLYTAADKVVLTNDLAGIRRLEMGQVTPSSVNELARIDYDIQNTTEIINPRQDVSNVGAAFGSTATGVDFLRSRTTLRLKLRAKIFQSTFLEPLSKILNWYNKQLVTDDLYYRVAGDDNKDPYRSLPASAFATQVDFKPMMSPDKLTLSERRDNLAYLVQTIAQVEGRAPGINDMRKIMDQVYKLAGFPHPSEYTLPPQTIIIQTPDGQLKDKNGNPAQVMQVDETGKPLPPPQEGGQPPDVAGNPMAQMMGGM